MSNWADVSKEAREAMEFIGSFGPTINPLDRTVKGWVPDTDGEVRSAYLGSAELREMATYFHEVADWLDVRAEEAARRAPAGTTDADYIEASRIIGRNALVEMDAPEAVAAARAVCDAYTGITRSAPAGSEEDAR